MLCSSPLTLSLSSTSKAVATSSFVPSTAFISTLRSAIDGIQKATSIVSPFSGGLLTGGHVRLSSAVSDCLDLLALSSDELSWTLSASGTGSHPSDIRSWLSAALGNQDTCREGLDNTGSLLGSLVAGSLEVVNSLVAAGLADVATADRGRSGGGRRRLKGFPEWVSAGDRRMLQAEPDVAADAVVAQDGSGDYTTVSEAVDAAPSQSRSRYVIYVKKGVYVENVEVNKKKWNLMLIGDGIGETVISGSRSYLDGWTTYRSATVAVAGKGFIARDLTIENTAGPQKHQAVALRSDSDLSVFYQCGFAGYQDTLYAHSLRQFYRDCVISGTVDFIFGNAAAVFQSCLVLPRLPLQGQKNSVTAHGRKDSNQNTGFSFQFCNVSADADLQGSTGGTPTYLGRPWKEYSRTVFMQSYLGPAVRPEGWLAWNGDFALSTLYYGEYMNSGPGSGLENRVGWPGFHAISDAAVAVNFTVAQFIDGDMWLPSTGITYTSGF